MVFVWFFPLINFVGSLLIWATVTLVENKPAPGKSLVFQRLFSFFILILFFSLFFP